MLIKTGILNPVSPEKAEFIRKCFLEIRGDVIVSVSDKASGKDFIDYSDYLCTPGFIDLHAHLSQFSARGNSNPQLLDWLNNYVFPEEIKSFNPPYAEKIAEEFFTELKKSGTTSVIAYVSASEKATDIAFRQAEKAGIRVWAGNVQMDCNAPEKLCASTEENLRISFALFEKWHQKTPLLNYIFTPRFAPVCSRELMKETGDYALKNKIKIQSHLSENHNENLWVKDLFPECKSYTEVYLKYGLLGENTIMAHCLHLQEREIKIMAETGTKIAHCPESNLFLKSGIFPLKEIEKAELSFGLGSDVAAGSSLFMPYHMRIMDYMQIKNYVPPEKTFYSATLGSAKVLNEHDSIGSIEVGKQADLAFWEIKDYALYNNARKIIQTMQYLPDKASLKELLVAGKKVL
ncbi:MAG: hypothetical protein CSB55_06260 [Candidatus Cloacimonadota bacterium]|nr:MAG: hypothetical protein CSB55_06260 [Candidatus Cloacimonadota bacterium]